MLGAQLARLVGDKVCFICVVIARESLQDRPIICRSIQNDKITENRTREVKKLKKKTFAWASEQQTHIDLHSS